MVYTIKWIWVTFLLGALCANAQITNKGELTIAPGTQLSVLEGFSNLNTAIVSNQGEMILYSDFSNEGTFSFLDTSSGERTVRFQGNKIQSITGNGNNRFYSLVFYNPFGPTAFELAASFEVVNQVNFLQGVVKNEGFGGKMIFGTSANHISTSSQSHMDGSVQKLGNTAFTFPIGNGDFYRKSAISGSTISNTDFESRYRLENSSADHPHNLFLGNIAFIDDMEYWMLQRIQGSGNVILTLNWDVATTPDELLKADKAVLHIVRWDDAHGKWLDEGGVANIGQQSVATTVELTQYGVFTLAMVSDDDTDTDGDGVPDFVENNNVPPSNPNDPNDYTDTDGDGVPDFVENNNILNSDPNDSNSFIDNDGDGIPDYVEEYGVDSDGDGVPDFVEITEEPSSDPNNPNDFVDSDGDGVPDYIEISQNPNTNPKDPNDYTDTDGDGVPDYVEENGNPTTDSNNPTDFTDSDGDGVPDYVETHNDPATDPNNPNDYTDSDGDGVPDYVEENGSPATNPNDSNDFTDTDGDGVPDYVEENGSPATNPNNPNDFVDSDGDGVPDYVEENGSQVTDPNNPNDFADSDGDGIPDYNEDRYTKTDIFIENDLVSKSLSSGHFEIINIELFPENKVEIFNRNGIKVFSVEGYDNNSKVFQGVSNAKATLQKGDGLPTGVYFYIIEYTQEGNGKTKSGYLYIKE